MNTEARLAAEQIFKEGQQRLERLQTMQPLLFDVSLRENPVGGRVGHTLQDKLEIFEKLREFGFRNIILGALNYALPDELEVDDDFMMYLRDHNIDRKGCFAFTSVGLCDETGLFHPDISQLKLKEYEVQHTIHEIYLSEEGMEPLYDLQTLLRSLPQSLQWLRQNTSSKNEKTRIYVNIVDGCDALVQDPKKVYSVLELLAKEDIEGISFQDDRGTFMPCQIGSFTKTIRSFMPAEMKLLIHVHAGAGYENAAVIEALLNGADGVWGALAKCGPVVGHASLGELIANLIRAGNPNLSHLALDQMIPLIHRLEEIDTKDRGYHDEYHMLGSRAYKLTLSFFKQEQGRFMDLHPDVFGGKYAYRICPVVSDPDVIAGRLAEVLNEDAQKFPEEVTTEMMRLMRRDLRAGKKIAYDEPANLISLYNRANDKK